VICLLPPPGWEMQIGLPSEMTREKQIERLREFKNRIMSAAEYQPVISGLAAPTTLDDYDRLPRARE